MVKDLNEIRNGSFEVIHIFMQITFSIVNFGEWPAIDLNTKRYPHIVEHEKLVSQYLALAIATYWFTKNYKSRSLASFYNLAGNSAIDLPTVLLAIRKSLQISEEKKSFNITSD